MLLERGQYAIGQTGTGQRPPEPVPGPGEVMPYNAGVQAWIDPDEQHVQAGGDHVRHRAAVRRGEVIAGGPSRPARHGKSSVQFSQENVDPWRFFE